MTRDNADLPEALVSLCETVDVPVDAVLRLQVAFARERRNAYDRGDEPSWRRLTALLAAIENSLSADGFAFGQDTLLVGLMRRGFHRIDGVDLQIEFEVRRVERLGARAHAPAEDQAARAELAAEFGGEGHGAYLGWLADLRRLLSEAAAIS